MDKLIAILGPAPSEDLEFFAKRLAAERLRVGEMLKEFRETPEKKTKTKKAKGKGDSAALSEMKALGISSVQELIALVKEAQKNAANSKDN